MTTTWQGIPIFASTYLPEGKVFLFSAEPIGHLSVEPGTSFEDGPVAGRSTLTLSWAPLARVAHYKAPLGMFAVPLPPYRPNWYERLRERLISGSRQLFAWLAEEAAE